MESKKFLKLKKEINDLMEKVQEKHNYAIILDYEFLGYGSDEEIMAEYKEIKKDLEKLLA